MRKLFHQLTFLITVSVPLSACGSSETPEGPETPNGGNQPVIVEPGLNKDLYGQITDNDGNPVQGVVVSDGTYSVVTNINGIYQIKRDPDAKFVYYSTPAEYEIETAGTNDWAAKFYKTIPENAGVHRQDFKLTKRTKAIGDFTIIAMGDPQVARPQGYTRWTTETMPKLLSETAKMSDPMVMLVMGDINEDKVEYMKEMRESLGQSGMPVFTTPGNHDKHRVAGDDSAPRTATDYSSFWGPLDYTFQMGDVLFISMDNVRYTNGSNYTGGFTDKQVEWLRQQIQTVSKDKMVVMFYHIPLRTDQVTNRVAILDLLNGFREIHLMCGHTHWQENYEGAYPTRFEHIHATACGGWWNSQVNVDGVPNGFMVYNVSGSLMKNWYYQPTKSSTEEQMRLHRGDWAYTGNGVTSTYGFPGNVLIANVWNADSKWKIEVYEDDVYSGEMTRLTSNPQDAWTKGLLTGYYGHPAGTASACKHLYYYELKNRNARIKVMATDRFGNIYTETRITTDFKDGIL